MLKYLSKFASDILPSVAATIIGAYIVNHYIASKPATDAPAAAVSSVDAGKAGGKNDAAPAEASTDLANIPAAGVRAKGISEKSILEKPAEKPAAEKAAEKPAEKSEQKPAETASLPLEGRRHPPVLREKTAAKPVVTPVQPAVAPVVTAPASAPPVEAAIAPDEHRDANDLARAAIERLRGMKEGSSHPQEAARAPEPPRNTPAPPVEAPRVASAPVRPLPPPVMVSSPAGETVEFDDRIHAGAAAHCDRRRRQRPAAPDAPGRYSGRAAARSACRCRRTGPAPTHDGCRRDVVGGEIGVSRGPAAISPHSMPAGWNAKLASRPCRRRASNRFVRPHPPAGCRPRGHSSRRPWFCRRGVHTQAPG